MSDLLTETCGVFGCAKRVHARGRCRKHYEIARKYDYALPEPLSRRPRRLARSKLGAVVDAIRLFHAAGVPQAELARRYAVHHNTIWRIVHYETWLDDRSVPTTQT